MASLSDIDPRRSPPESWARSGDGILESRWAIVAAAAGIFLAALVLRIGLLNATPLFDELYHLLAARGWQETGRLSILDGEYTRGAPYTLAVARLFEASGQDSAAVGRLVSLLPGALLPVAVFLWLRAVAGWLAAGIAAAFTILWPQGIIESQFLRFYSAQVLAFFIGAVAVYQAVAARAAARIAWGVVAAVALGLALKLQVTTAIGVLAMLLWGVGLAVMSIPGPASRRWQALAVLAVLAVVGFAGLWALGYPQKAWHIYRWVPVWAEADRDYATVYHHLLRHQYFGFWTFFPVAAIVAFRANARLAAFSVTIFVVAFLAHSFGGMKALRYLSYAVPFFFVLWGLALSVAVPALLAQMRAFGWPKALVAGVSLAGLAFILGVNGFMSDAAKLAAGKAPDVNEREDWSAAGALLDDWNELPFRMTNRELHMVAYVGDYDIMLDKSRLSEVPGGQDFGIDPRTGRPVIASQEALQQVFACEREGVLVGSRARWDQYELDPVLAAAAAQEGLQIDRRESGPVLAIHWSDPAGVAPDCSGMPAG